MTSIYRRCAAYAVALVPLLAQDLAAQGAAGVTGRVIDARSNAPLGSAGVQIVGTTQGTMTDVDGSFRIVGVRAGTITLQVRRIGYSPKTITGLMLSDGEVLQQTIALEPAPVELAAQRVTAAARGSVNEALESQRNAGNVMSGVTQEQIARSPDSDAAQAVQRVSGVTVQDGRYVFVRGLGERYTTTSLNGSRLPSPEPERKVVPLDLFPSGLLQSVTTAKTFTPDLPGDFSGAQVDLRTREFPARRQFVYSTAVGFNDAAVGTAMPAPRDAGGEWFAAASGRRAAPATVLAAGAFEQEPSQRDVNAMVRGFRNAWTPTSRGGTPNGSLNAAVGGNDAVLGQRIGYLASGTYSYTQEIAADYQRAQPIAGDVPGSTVEGDRYAGEIGRSSVLWGGLLNLSTLLPTGTRVALNNTYSRTADNEARREQGFSENLGTQLEVRRMRYVERSIRSNQLVLEQALSSRQRLEASMTTSGVSRHEPDRSEIVYGLQRDPATNDPLPAAWLSQNSEGAVRTFGDLTESNLEGALSYRLELGAAERPAALKVGALYRASEREAENHAYGLLGALSRQQRERSPEDIFADPALTTGDTSIFRIVLLGAGGSYDATDRLAAGFLMTELPLGSRVRLVGGARLEQSSVTVRAQATTGAPTSVSPRYTDVLPSVALNVRLGATQALRLSASQTLARPEYRELAPVQYRDVIGGDVIIGNASLRRTLIQNADMRWEWYPQDGEVLSLAAFAKRFHDPIERIYLATSGTRIVTFANAEGAHNFGVELEARKGLGFIGEPLEPVSLFSNVTLMRSDIRIGGSSASRTNDDRAMVGQAPYVVNAGLTYMTRGGRGSVTALYNVVGERIVNAAEAPLPDVIERPRHVFDLSLQFPVVRQVTGRLSGRNLLDAPYRLEQGTVVREAYRSGRVFQFGLAWQP